MTAFVRDSTASHGIKFWIPRRAAGKQTYGGMLDNTVAGGLTAGEEPIECLVRESDEEASLPEKLVRENATSHGTITYIYIRGSQAGGETGMVRIIRELFSASHQSTEPRLWHIIQQPNTHGS